MDLILPDEYEKFPMDDRRTKEKHSIELIDCCSIDSH